MLTLPYGLSFADLYARDGLAKIDRHFVEALQAAEMRRWPRDSPLRARPRKRSIGRPSPTC